MSDNNPAAALRRAFDESFASPSAPSTRWMVLVGTTGFVGFAFETFEAHLQVPSHSLGNVHAPTGAGEARRRDIQAMIRAAGALRPVIDMTSLVRRLRSDES